MRRHTKGKGSNTVEKIIYPKIDPLSDSGNEKDLYPKKEIRSFPKPDSMYLH